MKEHFFHKDTYQLLKTLDESARLGRTSRGTAFEDFLEMSVCALSAGQMEEAYLKIVSRYADGEKGKRGVDKLAELFAQLIAVMEETRSEILGDLFMGAITYGENGQFYTPESVNVEVVVPANEGEQYPNGTVFNFVVSKSLDCLECKITPLYPQAASTCP